MIDRISDEELEALTGLTWDEFEHCSDVGARFSDRLMPGWKKED